MCGAPWREPPREGAGPTKPASREDSGAGAAWQVGAVLQVQEEEAGKRCRMRERGVVWC